MAVECGGRKRMFMEAVEKLSENDCNKWVQEVRVRVAIELPAKNTNEYLRRAHKQGLIERDKGWFRIVAGKSIHDLNMSTPRQSRSLPSLPTAEDGESARNLLQRVQELTEYVQHLEDRLERSEQANRDKDDYIRRCLTTAPDPRRFRFPIEAKVGS